MSPFLSATIAAGVLLCGALARAEQTLVEPATEAVDFATSPSARMLSVSGYEADPEIAELLAPYAAQVAVLEAPIALNAQEMDRTMAGDWMADVVREAASQALGEDVHLGFVNRGGVRTLMPAGKVSRATMMEIMPFDNAIVVFTVPGDQMLLLGSIIASRVYSSPGFPISEGARITVDDERQLVEFTIGGEPVTPERDYLVATSSYLAGGGDNMELLSEDMAPPRDTGVLIRDAMIAHALAVAEAGGEIQPPAPGRYVRPE
ncbi:MAG: 5'-nucleotidase [Sumerlaeia bacterium]